MKIKEIKALLGTFSSSYLFAVEKFPFRLRTTYYNRLDLHTNLALLSGFWTLVRVFKWHKLPLIRKLTSWFCTLLPNLCTMTVEILRQKSFCFRVVIPPLSDVSKGNFALRKNIIQNKMPKIPSISSIFFIFAR